MDIAKTNPRRGRLRLDRKRALARGLRLSMTPEPGKRSTQIKVSGGHARREVRRELETVYGIFEIPLLEIHQSKIMVRLCAVVLEFDCTGQAAQRLLILRTLALRGPEANQFVGAAALRARCGMFRGSNGRGILPSAPVS
jgi:hypothetical protein